MKSLKKFTLALTLAVGLAACTTTQNLNEEAAQSYRAVQQEAKSQGVLDTSSATAKRIHAVFNKMRPYAERENKTGVPFQWEISVVRSDELNAWAMPGGKMMFYTGLVEKLRLTDDEIATVMGHEMAHALEEHGKSDRTFSTITGVLGAVADVAVTAATGVNTEGLLSTGVDLIANKPFSRSQETEADEVGLFLMAKSGYNPQAAPNVWVKMSEASGGSGGVLEKILSTHPINADRQANLQRLMPKAMKVYRAR